MLTAPHAFVLGHAVPIVGIYFRAVDMLAHGKQRAPLAARATELLAMQDGRKGDVVANVRRVESLLAEIPANAGAPPRFPNEFDAWSQRILDVVEAQVKPAHVALATLHLIGRLAGGGLQALNVATYAIALDAAAPGDDWVAAQLATDRAELARLAGSLRGSAALFSGGDAARAALVELADDFAAAALVDLGATQAAMKRCGARLSTIEAGLAA